MFSEGLLAGLMGARNRDRDILYAYVNWFTPKEVEMKDDGGDEKLGIRRGETGGLWACNSANSWQV